MKCEGVSRRALEYSREAIKCRVRDKSIIVERRSIIKIVVQIEGSGIDTF